ncbi:MAG: metal ABC transporter substrate-binding protein [Candidatus Zixiibacteriota bacterium]
MKKYTLMSFALLLAPVVSTAQMKVVASTSDLAYFARQIGLDLVEVESIASPKTDVHFVEVRPSYMMKVAKADVVLKVGLELDMWMDKIIDGSRNSKLEIVDCSKYVRPLEVPTFKADARYGDLHRFGNPHYWLGPQNVRLITDAIVDALSAADPQHASEFKQNQETYLVSLETELETLKQKAATLAGKEVVFYHNSWPYFCAFTGIVAAGFVEPYPGVAPSPSHIKEMIDLMRSKNIKAIAVEPYFDKRVPDKIAAETGAKVITAYPSVGGRIENETYTQWLAGNIEALLEAIK